MDVPRSVWMVKAAGQVQPMDEVASLRACIGPGMSCFGRSSRQWVFHRWAHACCMGWARK